MNSLASLSPALAQPDSTTNGKPTTPETGELIVAREDYLRLRELLTDHALAQELERAIVLPMDRIPADIVTMNSRFTYRDENTGVSRELELVYPEEAQPEAGKVSVLAPVGCAMLGLRAGQAIDWALPDGRLHRLRVERILFQARPAGE